MKYKEIIEKGEELKNKIKNLDDALNNLMEDKYDDDDDYSSDDYSVSVLKEKKDQLELELRKFEVKDTED